MRKYKNKKINEPKDKIDIDTINVLSSDYVMMTVIGIQMVLKDQGHAINLTELFNELYKKDIIKYLFENCNNLSTQNNYEVVKLCIDKLNLYAGD